MISDIKDILNFIYGLYKSSINKEKGEFDFYITNIFNRTKIIEQNYIEILSSLRYNMLFQRWDGNNILEYLLKVENDFRNERIYIRAVLKKLNSLYDSDIEIFVESIFNIMYCERVCRFHTKNIEHRLAGLIRDARLFQYNSSYKNDFLENVDYMLDEINMAWEVTCSEYLRLKEKVFK